MSERAERANAIAGDLDDRQHRHRGTPPGIPHIQNQKTSDSTTRNGLSVKRRASSSRSAPRLRSYGPPDTGADGNNACQSGSMVKRPASRKITMAAAGRNWRIVQQERHRPQKTRSPTPVSHMIIAVRRQPTLHDGHRHEIGGDVAFDFFSDGDRLAPAAEVRQDLDEPAQELSPETRRKYENSTVVNRPAAKLSPRRQRRPRCGRCRSSRLPPAAVTRVSAPSAPGPLQGLDRLAHRNFSDS